MKMILVSTTFKSGRNKGRPRETFKDFAESYGTPHIDYETGVTKFCLKDDKGNSYRIFMSPADMVELMSHMPLGLFSNLSTEEHASVIKTIGKIIESFESRKSSVDKSIH